jgi:crossover junction endodeoxyribonuclease RuvC
MRAMTAASSTDGPLKIQFLKIARSGYTQANMRVLGIDCGTEYTGYGIVDLVFEEGRDERCSDPRFAPRSGNDHLVCVACGAIKASPRDPMPVRLACIARGLETLIALHQPNRVAIEDVFYAVNVKSALKLGQVRGVAMLIAATAGLDVAEYSPLSIKSAVVGYGKAEKHQVQQMVASLLRLDQIPEPPDAADALAIAICHLHTAATLELQVASLGARVTSKR